MQRRYKGMVAMIIESKISKTRLFYREAGSGTPVVLLHGSAGSGAQWQDTVSRMRKRYRVITPDLPGYGGSETDPAQPADSLTTLARAIIDLIDHIGEPVHLVGHSIGAAIAVRIAMSARARIKSLTLFEPTLYHFLRNGGAADQAIFTEISDMNTRLVSSAQDDVPHEGMREFIDHRSGEGTWANLNESMRDAHAADIGNVLRDFAASASQSWSLDEVERIACPTLAYVGLDTSAASRRMTEIIARAIPKARLNRVSGAGHMLAVTHPDIVAGALERHIAAAARVVRTNDNTAALAA